MGRYGSEVQRYYDRTAKEEWDRLERHRLEYEVTIRILEAYLEPRSRVLDAGGGPGRYSIHLAERGHDVTLLDLSRACVDLAREKAREQDIELAGYHCGDARDLSAFPSQSFDAVLLMGPLYHLLDEDDRRAAVREALRVITGGGLLFAAFIGRYAPLLDMARAYPEQIDYLWDRIGQVLADGINLPSEDPDFGFTAAHFAHPDEIRPFMEDCGLATLRLCTVEGIGAPVAEGLYDLGEEQFQLWVDLLYQIGDDPCLFGAGDHMLYVGRK